MNIFNKLLTGMLAAMVFCCLPGCRKKPKASSEPQAYVTLGQLQKRIFQKQLPAKGIVHPIDFAVISARTEGVLANMNIVEGDYAKAGDILFCLDRTNLESIVAIQKDKIDILDAILERARIKLETAELHFKQLERDYERERKLREANVNSQASFEAVETSFRTATLDITDSKVEIAKTEARLQQARNNLAIAQRNLENTMCKAPYDCIVTERYVEPHEYVKQGQRIMKIENHDRLQVFCDIDASHYDEIAVGRTRAEIFSKGQSVCSGIVTYKASSIEPEKQVFKLKITVPKNTALISGSPCDLKLILLEKEAWGLPANALLPSQDNHLIAFVAQEDGTAKSVQITPGIADGKFTEVNNAQELRNSAFIMSGLENLADGMSIGIRQ